MNIQKSFLTVNMFSRPRRKLKSVKGIVIHWVGNAGSSAKANHDYFEGLSCQTQRDANARYASAHFIIGLNGEIIQCLPLDEMAYHVGAKAYTDEALKELSDYPNDCTLGIELCHSGWTGECTELTLEAALELSAELCRAHGLNPLTDIWRHYDITGKECPRWFVKHPDEFDLFKRGVQQRINAAEGGI